LVFGNFFLFYCQIKKVPFLFSGKGTIFCLISNIKSSEVITSVHQYEGYGVKTFVINYDDDVVWRFPNIDEINVNAVFIGDEQFILYIV